MAANRAGRRQNRGAAPGPGGLEPDRGSAPGPGGLEPDRGSAPGPGGLEPDRGTAPGPGGLEPDRGTAPGPGGLEPDRGSPGRSPGVQRRSARVTVKYNRQELQRRLHTERWIDGRLGELYRGQEGAMPDELNIEELLELDTDQERTQKLQTMLSSCPSDTQEFVQQLLQKLRGLPKLRLLLGPLPQNQTT